MISKKYVIVTFSLVFILSIISPIFIFDENTNRGLPTNHEDFTNPLLVDLGLKQSVDSEEKTLFDNLPLREIEETFDLKMNASVRNPVIYRPTRNFYYVDTITITLSYMWNLQINDSIMFGGNSALKNGLYIVVNDKSLIFTTNKELLRVGELLVTGQSLSDRKGNATLISKLPIKYLTDGGVFIPLVEQNISIELYDNLFNYKTLYSSIITIHGMQELSLTSAINIEIINSNTTQTKRIIIPTTTMAFGLEIIVLGLVIAFLGLRKKDEK